MENRKTDKREEALRKEKIPKLIMKMSSPAIMAMIVMSVYNMVDALFMGMLGTEALGASTIGYPYLMLLSAFGLTLGMGGASYQSRLLGSGEKDMAEKTVATVFITGAVLGVSVALLTTPFSEGIARVFGANDKLLEPSAVYIKILSMGALFPILSMCANNLLRAEGSAMQSLFGMGIGSVINIALDPLLMFSFGMGVKGAALATVISQALGMMILLSFYLRKKTLVKFHFRQFFPKGSMYGEILKVGAAVFLQQLLVTLTMAVTNRVAAMLGGIKSGDALVAAIGIINRLSMLGFSVMMGFGQGLQPVIGFNYGANQHLRVKKAINFAFFVTTVFGLFLAAISFIVPGQLASLFSKSPEVLIPAILGIKAMSIAWPVAGFFFVTQVLFQALGRPAQAMTLASVRQFFTLLAVWGLSLLYGPEGLMVSLSVSLLFSIGIAVVLYLPYKKELSNQIAGSTAL